MVALPDAQPPIQPLALPAVMDLAAAGPLHAGVLARLGGSLEVDASEVRRLGGQCLQVLLAAQARWSADGAAFRVLDASPELVEGLELLGARALLADPSPTHAGADAPAELTA